MNDTVTIAGGTFDLAQGGATTTLNLADSTFTGDVVFDASGAGAVTIGDAGTLTIVPHSSFISGSLTIVNGDAGDEAGEITVNDTGLATFALSNSGGSLVLTATPNSPAAVAQSLNVTTKEAEALTTASTSLTTAIAQNSTPALVAAQNDLNTALANGGTQAKQAAQKIAPDVQSTNTGTTAVVTTTSRANVTNVGARLNTVRGTSAVTGLSSGNASNAQDRDFVKYQSEAYTPSGEAYNNFWVRAIGSTIDQDEKDGVAGFEADVYGATVGADTHLSEDLIVGLAFGYSQAEIDGESAANSNTDINAYQGMIYADYSFGQSYVTGLASYTYNDIEVGQDFLGGGRLNGDYTTGQYGANFEYGYNYNLKNGAIFTPNAGLEYIFVEGEDVVMTGPITRTDSIDDTEIFVAKIGGRLEKSYQGQHGIFTPEIHGNILYDFIGDESEASSTFAGNATPFINTGAEVEQESLNLGAGLSFETLSGLTTLSITYDSEIKQDYLAHTGQAKISVKF